MERHMSRVQDVNSFTSTACDLRHFFDILISNSCTISYTNRPFSHSSRAITVSSQLPENSTREKQCGKGSTNTRTLRQNADKPPLPGCVIMKKQPFYDHKKDILQSWYYAPVFCIKKHFSFMITHDVAKSVAEQDYKILLRFCCLDSSREQDDKFPPKLLVQVNGKVCDTKGGSFPINITALCDVTTGTSNVMQVSSASGQGEYYVVSLSLVKKLIVNDLMHKLKTKKPSKVQDTKALIKGRLKQDKDKDAIATTTLQCSLVCPLTVTRMIVPCRGIYCQHFQCFDAVAYLQVNEQKSLWICPVCNCPARFPDLLIDGYFQKVLAQANKCSKVSLLQDGSWTPVAECYQQTHTKKYQGTVRKRTSVEIVVIDSDEECPHVENDKEVTQIRETDRVLRSAKHHRGNSPVDPLEISGRLPRRESQTRKSRPRRCRS